jgi:hypothetical protein
LLPLAAQFLQGAHAAFVASPPGADALADPRFLGRQTFVEQRLLLLLRRQGGFFAFQKRIVVAGPVEQLASFQFQNPIRQSPEEHPVVRDEHQGRRPVVQKTLEPLDRLDVQMVRRFIQQQQIRLADQRPGQQDATLHPGRKRFELRLTIQLHPRQDPLDLLLLAPLRFRVVVAGCQSARNNLVDFALQSDRYLLSQPRNRGARLEDDAAAIGFQVAGQDAQQGRLARPVAAQQPDTLPRMDLAIDRIQQDRAAKTDTRLRTIPQIMARR